MGISSPTHFCVRVVHQIFKIKMPNGLNVRKYRSQYLRPEPAHIDAVGTHQVAGQEGR